MDDILRERYLTGFKGSRKQTLAKLFWLDVAFTLLFFFPQRKQNMFLTGRNTDENKICISEKVLFLLHLQGLDYPRPE